MILLNPDWQQERQKEIQQTIYQLQEMDFKFPLIHEAILTTHSFKMQELLNVLDPQGNFCYITYTS